MSMPLFPKAIAILALLVSPAVAQTAIPPSPQNFADAAAQDDAYVVMAARLAAVQGQDLRVLVLAQDMIRDHMHLMDDLRRAATTSGLQQPDPGLSSDSAPLLAGLQGLRGAAFDKAYVHQQVLVHTRSAAVTDRFAAAGANAGLREAARSALPLIEGDLAKAKDLDMSLGDP